MIRTLEHPPWHGDSAVGAVYAALTADGQTVRFVGGCVRDALLGLAHADLDLATPDPPDRVMGLARAAGLAAIPTGIAHGTVTVVADHRPVEVTTLRRDLATDGRRAEVQFTDDWAADAARRDFTINALYAGWDGRIVDPVGGLDDLASGTVRFIGDAATRIAEDYLRILRFFRFHGRFGRGAPDAVALAAIGAALDGLDRLSAERVRDELLKSLALDTAAAVIALMAEVGVLARLLPEAGRADRLAALVSVERCLAEADPVRRLVALIGSDPADMATVARRLKLSNAERQRAVDATKVVPGLDPSAPAPILRRQLYRLGPVRAGDLVRLAWAEHAAAGLVTDDGPWLGLVATVDNFEAPALPVTGGDLLALGVPEGPRLGAALGRLEQWWLERDMVPDRAACLAELRLRLGAGP